VTETYLSVCYSQQSPGGLHLSLSLLLSLQPCVIACRLAARNLPHVHAMDSSHDDAKHELNVRHLVSPPHSPGLPVSPASDSSHVIQYIRFHVDLLYTYAARRNPYVQSILAYSTCLREALRHCLYMFFYEHVSFFHITLAHSYNRLSAH